MPSLPAFHDTAEVCATRVIEKSILGTAMDRLCGVVCMRCLGRLPSVDRSDFPDIEMKCIASTRIRIDLPAVGPHLRFLFRALEGVPHMWGTRTMPLYLSFAGEEDAVAEGE